MNLRKPKKSPEELRKALAGIQKDMKVTFEEAKAFERKELRDQMRAQNEKYLDKLRNYVSTLKTDKGKYELEELNRDFKWYVLKVDDSIDKNPQIKKEFNEKMDLFYKIMEEMDCPKDKIEYLKKLIDNKQYKEITGYIKELYTKK